MDNAAVIWLVIGFACVLLEVLTPVFGFVLVGASAVVAAAFAASHYRWEVQLFAFAAGSTLGLTFLRTRLIDKAARASPGVPSRTEKLLGHAARVTEAIDPATGAGRVLVDGHDWAAQAVEPIAAGAEVKVEGADGIRLRVRRV